LEDSNSRTTFLFSFVFLLISCGSSGGRCSARALANSPPSLLFHNNISQEAFVAEGYDNASSELVTIFDDLTPKNWAMSPVAIVRRGFAPALLLLLLFLAAARVSDAYICRYNCSTVNNIYCRTKEFVCPYPDGDDLAMERANMLLAKSTSKTCTRAMKLFICHLWFPTCEKAGAVGNVNPVRLFEYSF
jgi:hypothetical protein